MTAWVMAGLPALFAAAAAMPADALPTFEARIRGDVGPLRRAAGEAASGASGILTIATPHRLRLMVGREVIEIHPGGENSATMVRAGALAGSGVDPARIGQIATDSGAERMTRAEAVDLAGRWCRVAAAGLGKSPSPVRQGTIGVPRPDFPHQLTPLCLIETAHVRFTLSLSGPDDSHAAEPAYRVTLVLNEKP